MNLIIRITLITLAFGLWGCKARNTDVSATLDNGITGAFFCVAAVAKCEYGAGNVVDVGQVTGYADSDICQSLDGRPTWNLFDKEPFKNGRVCRFRGMTRVEMACKCDVTKGGGQGGGQTNGGTPRYDQQAPNTSGSFSGAANPDVAPQESGNFNGTQNSGEGGRYSWGNNQTARQEYLNVQLVPCATDGVGFLSAGMAARFGRNLETAPGGYCKKVDDFDGAISCHKYRAGQVNYNIMYSCQKFYKGDWSQVRAMRRGTPGVNMLQPN